MHLDKFKTSSIKDVLEGIYNDPIQRKKTVPLFMSNPGMGKTEIITDFMKEKGVYKPPFVLSQRMPFEVSGMALVDKNTDVMKYYDFDFLLELKDGDILFIDEAYNANPLTLSAFLTFLESRIMISGRKLPDIMIVAAANPQGMPVLTPQIKRRFLQYDVVFDSTHWENYMFNKYKIPHTISSKLSKLIELEDFTGYNFNTPADLDKNVDMMIKGIITPYSKILSPILNSIIENNLGDIEMDDFKLAHGESISWLKLKKIEHGIIKKQ